MNKKIILLFLALILLPLVASKTWEITASTDTNKIFYCHNNQSGVREGTTATINCTDSAFNVDLATAAATNKDIPGVFNKTLNLGADSYTCEVDCGTASSIDYTVDVFARTTPLVATDNIGINWADVSNQGTSVDLSATTTDTVDTCTALTTNNDKTGYALSVAGVDAIREDIAPNLTADHGSGAWTTATGFSTVSDFISISTVTNNTNQAIIGNWTQPICYDQNVTDLLDGQSTITGNQNTIDTNIEEINVTTQALPTFSEIDTGLNDSHSSGNWSNTASSGLTAASIASEVDTVLNRSHSEGNWSNTASSGLTAAAVASEVDSVLNQSHSTGNWTGKSGTATITAGDKAEIASLAWNETISNRCATLNASTSSATSGRYLCELFNYLSWVI
jgi:hypothetical protein